MRLSRRCLTWLMAFLVMMLSVDAPAASSARTSDPSTWRCSSRGLGLQKDRLELAPVSSTERGPDGSKIDPKPGPNGLWVPVIMVHGWTGRATHPNADGSSATGGAFSHDIDLTANRLGSASVGRSLIGQLQGLPGAAVFTLDYHPYSARWVTDEHIGPALGKAIDCLYSASGQKVIIVAHSMGGLAARYAASTPDRAGKISRIITLGTPNEGSVAALLGDAVATGTAAGDLLLTRQITTLRILLAGCGEATTQDLDSGVCGSVPPPAAAFDSEAGRALRFGSRELQRLPWTPKGITVNALAGRSSFKIPKIGWFSLPWETDTIEIGDLIVTSRSAFARSVKSKSVECAYQLSAVRGATDALALRAKLLTKNESAEVPWKSLNGPCFHSNLMRTIELSNEVMGLVGDDIAGVLTDDMVPSIAIPAGTCGGDDLGWPNERPIQLHNGRGYIGDPQQGNVSAVIELQLVGRVDVNQDGNDEVILKVTCSGSAPEYCCAGRSSHANYVVALTPVRGGGVQLSAPVIRAGRSGPGNEYGAALRNIQDVQIVGSSIITKEYIYYAEQYSMDEVGGDPFGLVTVRHVLTDGSWSNE